jgi:hypothetical protein
VALLAAAPKLDDDLREAEVGLASAFSLYSAAAASTALFGGDSAGYGDVALILLAAAAALDAVQNKAELGGIVSAGLERLTTRDPRREAECEAAAFLIAYYLGLPSFAFAPTALEAAKLQSTSLGLAMSSAGDGTV